jgi:hypothetical protein
MKKKIKELGKLFRFRMLLFWIIIVVILFVSHYFSSFLEEMIVNRVPFAWVLLFLWYLLWIGLLGTMFFWILNLNNGKK